MALCKIARKFRFYGSGQKFLWIHFWRSAIILTAKFLAARGRWVEGSVYGVRRVVNGPLGQGPFGRAASILPTIPAI